MKFNRVLIVALVLCTVLNGVTWSEPEKVASGAHFELAIDTQGVCWCEGWPWMYSYRNEAAGWQPEIEMGVDNWGHPCFDKGDTLWLLNVMSYTRHDGENWGEVEYIPAYASSNWNSLIAADSSGGVWVAWNTDWWNYWQVVYNHYEDGSWVEPQPLTDTQENIDREFGAITTDAYGRVWVGWVKWGIGALDSIKAVYHDDDGWSEDIMIDADSAWLQGLNLSPDREGGMWALWFCEASSRILKASYWNGESWSESETVVVEGHGPKIAVDAYNNAWAVWVQSPDNDVYYSFNNGSGWSEPAPVDTHPAVDRYPDIAVDGAGRVWCVWSSTRDDSAGVWASYTTSAGVEEEGFIQPPKSTIESILPNPFKSSTTIFYSVAGRVGSRDAQFVELKVFDVTGREIKVLESGVKRPGYYELVWNGKDDKGLRCASGVYFVRIHSNNFNANARLVLLR